MDNFIYKINGRVVEDQEQLVIEEQLGNKIINKFILSKMHLTRILLNDQAKEIEYKYGCFACCPTCGTLLDSKNKKGMFWCMHCGQKIKNE